MKDLEKSKSVVQRKNYHHLLSHLQSEVTSLDADWPEMLHVLRPPKGQIVRKVLPKMHLDSLDFFGEVENLLVKSEVTREDCTVLLFRTPHEEGSKHEGDELLSQIIRLLDRIRSVHLILGYLGNGWVAMAVAEPGEQVRKEVSELKESVGIVSAHEGGYDVARLFRLAKQRL